MVGQTISHYRIVEKLGEGGMGVVYKAEDIKLERTVALKFLAEHLLNDQEAKARFLREAKAAAGLHHSNVCPVHEIDEVEGKTFLAMAFLQGETLEDRIAKGPLSIKDALDIGRQVAEGLEAAHESGIVHRDIKPANVLVDSKGHATIMDFGLARLTEASRLTKAEQTMGTVAYMSPEQAQGQEVDSRTDIWALGCVLYEMVSGQRPFLGQYDQALFYEIVQQEPPPLTGLRTGVPIEFEFIVGKCLAKDAGDRPATAQEVARELRTLADKLKSGRSITLSTAEIRETTLMSRTTVAPAVARNSQRALQALVVLLGMALIVVSYAYWIVPKPERVVRRFSFAPEGVDGAAISPDGKNTLFWAKTDGRSSLWLRSLANESARELSGTAGATGGFWSPDSLMVGFATNAELKRVSINGGNPITLCKLPPVLIPGSSFLGGTWSPDGQRIIFASGGLLYQTPARGGEPELMFKREELDRFNRSPRFLPRDHGSQALVYSARATQGSYEAVVLLDLETGERRELGPGLRPVYSPEDAHLIYESADDSDAGLVALPFSLDTLAASGKAFPISDAGRGASVSRDGSLVYLDTGSNLRTLAWRSRDGEVLGTIGQPQPGLRDISLSPDGRWAAASASEGGPAAIWVYDLVRSTRTRLTFPPGIQMLATWSPLGSQVCYRSSVDGVNTLMRKPRDGSSEAVLVAQAATDMSNPDWSRDGRRLVYQEQSKDGDYDIAYRALDANGDASGPTSYLRERGHQRAPKLSPDSSFVAYCSDESGRLEVYVRPFPEGAGKWQASVGGGMQPRWRSDGKELYYVNGTALMAVSVSNDRGLILGQPKELFESPDVFKGQASPNYDVSADGQRFLTATPVHAQNSANSAIHVVLNWYEEFRNRNPHEN